MRIFVLSFLFLFSFCARQNKSLSDSDLLLNQLFVNIVNAGNPNALDKIVYSRAQADGSYVTQFNATNLDFYIYFQFTGNKQIPFSDKDSTGWDIAFNRYKAATNSGETNRFGLGGACKGNIQDYNAAIGTAAAGQNCSDANFILDQSTTTQGIGGAGAIFVGSPLVTEWYDYTIGFLSPQNEVFIIRSGTGSSYYAMRVEGYYSTAGTSGYPTIRWKKLP
ncbi:HmuY family protein [Leptospira sp. 96542]|nr:HmuY family protein [Leptospira sp. 96542]